MAVNKYETLICLAGYRSSGPANCIKHFFEGVALADRVRPPVTLIGFQVPGPDGPQFFNSVFPSH